MSRNRGDTSLLHVLRPSEWPPRESDGIAARGIEFSVRQSNPFRRATISRRAARAKVRAGTPQNTSSSVSRAHCALAAAGRTQGPSHPARLQDTLLKVRANPHGSRSTRSTSTPAIDLHRSNTPRARTRKLGLPSGACARGRAGPLSPCSDDEGSADAEEAIYENARAQLTRRAQPKVDCV